MPCFNERILRYACREGFEGIDYAINDKNEAINEKELSLFILIARSS